MTETRSFTIVHNRSDRADAQTVETMLSEREARDWLQRKAAEVGGEVSNDLVLTTAAGESWSAVEAE
jgi:hypothetical protein